MKRFIIHWTPRRVLLGGTLVAIACLFYYVVLSEFTRGWLGSVGKSAPVAVDPFPQEVAAAQLPATTILPHLEGPIQRGMNYVYCASFQLAWDELRTKAGPEGILVETDPPLATALNRARFPPEALSKRDVVAHMGLVREGILDEIRAEMTRKFPNAIYSLPGKDDAYLVAFAFLQKSLPFEEYFGAIHEPLAFHASSGDTAVSAFGATETAGGGTAAHRQLKVLDYVSDDDFIIRLEPKSDEIILAKVRPAGTLAETLDAVQKRLRERTKSKSPHLADKETLIVPKFALNVVRQYDELVPKHLLNTQWPHVFFKQAQQTIRFVLNEKGAELQSQVITAGEVNGDEVPAQPRHFVFDRPFQLYLKEQKAEQPYLVIWVDNAEFLGPANSR
jgi:hypothetical protein